MSIYSKTFPKQCFIVKLSNYDEKEAKLTDAVTNFSTLSPAH